MDKTVYEEFYGTGIESDINGQESLGVAIGTIVGFGLMVAGTSWFFKKLRQKSIEKMDAKVDDVIYNGIDNYKIVITSEEQMREHYRKLEKAIQKIKSKFKNKDKDYTYSTLQLITNIAGFDFTFDLRNPYSSEEDAVNKYRLFVKNQLPANEVFRDIFIESIPVLKTPLSRHILEQKILAEGVTYSFKKNSEGKYQYTIWGTKNSNNKIIFTIGDNLSRYKTFGTIIEDTLKEFDRYGESNYNSILSAFMNKVVDIYYEDIFSISADIADIISEEFRYKFNDRILFWNPNYNKMSDREQMLPCVYLPIKLK